MKLIPLHGKRGFEKFAKVDDEDFSKVAAYKWFVGNHGRVYGVIERKRINGKSWQKNVLLHRFIMNVTDSRQIDHKNCDVLDNRKCNLRFATHAQNQYNRPARNKSGIKGVTWHKGANKWMAQIEYNGKPYYLGLFTDIQLAAQAYDTKAKELFGEFAHDPTTKSWSYSIYAIGLDIIQ